MAARQDFECFWQLAHGKTLTKLADEEMRAGACPAFAL